jgi:hypothetical protein
VEILSHVIAVGSKRLERTVGWEELVELSKKDEVLLGCVDPEAERDDERCGGSGLPHRRHGGRHLRGSRP